MIHTRELHGRVLRARVVREIASEPLHGEVEIEHERAFSMIADADSHICTGLSGVTGAESFPERLGGDVNASPVFADGRNYVSIATMVKA